MKRFIRAGEGGYQHPSIPMTMLRIASAFITRTDFPAVACLFTGGVILLQRGLVLPSAAFGNEFGPPERNVGRALVFHAHEHPATFAFHGTGLGLGLVPKGADAADASFLMLVGGHVYSPLGVVEAYGQA